MKKINKIICEYKNGISEKEIYQKYGDFGNFIISEYKKKPIKTISQMVFKKNEKTFLFEKDFLKLNIYESYINGTPEKEIYQKYGDYSSLYLENLKKFLVSLIPEF